MTESLAPAWRTSEMKCVSGVRVMLRLAPITAMNRALYQSADSWTSVCSPQISGEAGGRSQYQS